MENSGDEILSGKIILQDLPPLGAVTCLFVQIVYLSEETARVNPDPTVVRQEELHSM